MASNYQPLPNDNSDSYSNSSAEDPKLLQPSSRKGWHPTLSTAKDVILIAFALLGFVSLLQGWNNNNIHVHPEAALAAGKTAAPSMTSCDCGNSTAEAVALGCKYDSLAAAWLPEHCRDDELTAEFERAGPGEGGKWTYWADKERTTELSLEDLAQMADHPDQRFYMTGHWHVIHCIFYWRKEHRARFNGKMVEPRSDSEKHIKHCGNIFLDPGHNTRAGVPLNTDEE